MGIFGIRVYPKKPSDWEQEQKEKEEKEASEVRNENL